MYIYYFSHLHVGIHIYFINVFLFNVSNVYFKETEKDKREKKIKIKFSHDVYFKLIHRKISMSHRKGHNIILL